MEGFFLLPLFYELLLVHFWTKNTNVACEGGDLKSSQNIVNCNIPTKKENRFQSSKAQITVQAALVILGLCILGAENKDKPQ